MTAMQIAKKSLFLITKNYKDALRIALVLYVISVVMGYLMSGIWSFDAPAGGFGNQTYSAGSILSIIIIAIVLVFVTLWVAVAWHRYVLLDEVPNGWIPKWSKNEITAYLTKGLVLIPLGILVMIPVMIVLVMVNPSSAAIGLIFDIFVGSFLGYMFLRICLVFPAVAVGENMTFSASWADTKEHSTTLIFLAVMQSAISFLLGWVSVPFGSGAASLLLDVSAQTLYGLWSLSVMTTLYGVIVEGREL